MMEEREFTIVNRETPRLESADKATGLGKYTDDLTVPNMAYAALVRSPIPTPRYSALIRARRRRSPATSAVPCRRNLRRNISTVRATRRPHC